MSNLKLAMDSAFWDQNLSSSITLDGTARSIPGEPFPLDGARASRGLRAQQLSFLGNGFPLGIIPCYSPTSHKELGPFSVQSFFKHKSSNWWLGLIGQIRPQNMLPSLKVVVPKLPKLPKMPKLPELPPMDEWEASMLIDFVKVASQPSRYIDFAKRAVNAVDNAVDRSRHSLNFCAQFALNEASSLFLSTEVHGDRKGRHSKAMFFHKLPDHDLTVEAALPELFVDRNGRYWDVPGSISLDLASLASESGLRYRAGIHNNIGQPQVLNATSGEPPSAQALDATADETPLALLPGLCAKAAFSYERSMDIWRQKEPEVDSQIDSDDDDEYLCPSYDVRLREPHAAISGIVGGTCAAWVGGRKALVSSSRKRSPLSADLYGSACFTYQYGKFEELFGDFSRVDARLDICSAFAFTKGAAHLVANVFGRSSKEVNPLASPRLNVALQQQIAGPIVFRVDSKLALGSTSLEKRGPHIEDVIYSLCYSMRLLGSGQVVAWYSPKRKEGMVELRLFEF